MGAATPHTRITCKALKDNATAKHSLNTNVFKKMVNDLKIISN